jgi:uncharacterized membrane protein YqiK
MFSILTTFPILVITVFILIYILQSKKYLNLTMCSIFIILCFHANKIIASDVFNYGIFVILPGGHIVHPGVQSLHYAKNDT